MPDTAITLKFGDREHHFWLPMARIEEIQRRCGAQDLPKSIEIMLDQMGQSLGHDKNTGDVVYIGGGAAIIRDVYEVIRCAAIGGGMAPLDAKTLVDEYVDGCPYAETVPVAWAILNAAIRGVSLKKKPEAEGEENPSPSAKEPS